MKTISSRLVLFLLLFVLIASASVFAQDETFGEAPSLAEQVEAGELPPVQERLPVNPYVVASVPETGTYGGTYRHPYAGNIPRDAFQIIYWEFLTAYTADTTQIVPNVLESLTPNEDASEWTLVLREGMHWSDGAPFTTADLDFAINNVMLDERLGGLPGWLRINGEPVETEVVDETTIIFRFAGSHSLLPERFTSFLGFKLVAYPRHYLEQFHADFNEDVDALVAESDQETWEQLFAIKSQGIPGTGRNVIYDNPDYPTLTAWRLVEPLEGGNRVVYERNPYYWKVDAEGNQLPYIDRIEFSGFQDAETLTLAVLNGEFDWGSGALAEKSLFFDNLERGNLRFVDLRPTESNQLSINFNLAHADEAKAEIFSNRDFRIAMSHAINRQEIIDIVYVGQCTPENIAPNPDSPFYRESMVTQYVEYDVDRANELLDSIGLDQRDDEGFRLLPNGERLEVVITVGDAPWMATFPEVAELLSGYWNAVGVDTTFEQVEMSIFGERRINGQGDVLFWSASGGGGLQPIFNPEMFVPVRENSAYATRWWAWYVGGDQNADNQVEPPADVQAQMDLFDQVITTTDEAERLDLMNQVIDIAEDQFYNIGLCNSPVEYRVVNRDLANVPTDVTSYAFAYSGMGNLQMEAWFFADGS